MTYGSCNTASQRPDCAVGADAGGRRAGGGHPPVAVQPLPKRNLEPPPDFEKHVNAALDKLERAEKAGRKAYEKALAEGA